MISHVCIGVNDFNKSFAVYSNAYFRLQDHDADGAQ
jgi:hypothetical protein